MFFGIVVSRILRPILGQGERVHQIGVRPEIQKTSINAHACIPTFRRIEELLPEKVQFACLQPLWDSLPSELRDGIIADHFHLSQNTGELVLAHRQLAPDYCFPTRFDVEKQDVAFNRFLQNTRVTLKKKQKRGLQRRNQRILKWHLQGESNKEIANRVALAPGTIGGIIKKLQNLDSTEH